MDWSRAGTALAIAVVCGAIAAAAMPDPSTDDSWSIQLPALSPGASGIYERGNATLSFAAQLERFVDADGRPSDLVAITQVRDDISVWTQLWGAPTPEVRKVWVRNGQVVGALVPDHGEYAGIFVLYGENETKTYGDFVHHTLHYGNAQGAICGLVSAGRLASGTPWQAPSCPAPLQGVLPVLRASAQGVHVVIAAGAMELVFHPDMPVPVSIDLGDGAWLLRQYDPGTPSHGTTSPPLNVPTARGMTPDETGIEHVFPLSQALAEVSQRTPMPPLAQALSRPTYHLVDARFTERIDEGVRHYQWHLTASDGYDAVSMTVTRSAPQGDESSARDGLLPRGLATVPATMMSRVDPPAGPFPSRPLEPPRLADLAPLAARWEASGGKLSSTAAWGFSLRCGQTCQEATAITWYGRNDVRGIQEESYGLVCQYDCQLLRRIPRVDLLAVDEDGRSQWRAMTSWRVADQAYYVVDTIVVREGQEPPPEGGQVQSATVMQRSVGGAAAGITLAGILAGLAWYFAPSLQVLVRGRSRLVIDHPLRLQIQQLLARSPGIHLRGMARALGQATGTMRHHLRVMESRGDIISRRSGGFNCYFLASGTDRHMAGAASALKAPAARQILTRTLQGPVEMGSAAAAAGISPGAATHHATRLEQAGLVERHRVGKFVELRATPLAAQAIETLT